MKYSVTVGPEVIGHIVIDGQLIMASYKGQSLGDFGTIDQAERAVRAAHQLVLDKGATGIKNQI